MAKYLVPLFFLALAIPCSAQERKCFIVPCQSKLATTLTAAHMALAFADTWQTQRNHDAFLRLPGGYFEEYNPLTRPFQTHGRPLAYASTAAGVVGAAFLADRMRRSSNRFIRKVWWIPQVALSSANILAIAYSNPPVSQ